MTSKGRACGSEGRSGSGRANRHCSTENGDCRSTTMGLWGGTTNLSAEGGRAPRSGTNRCTIHTKNGEAREEGRGPQENRENDRTNETRETGSERSRQHGG